jgi:hypothetical protein
LEFTSFRRATQQIFEEGLVQTREHAASPESELCAAIKEFPIRCSEPLQAAFEQASQAMNGLATALRERLDNVGNTLITQVQTLASSASAVTSSLEHVQARLQGMQTPDGVIEVKLQPFISGFTKAINNQSKATGAQMGDLLKLISRFDEAVRHLAHNLSSLASRQSDEQGLLRQLMSKLESDSSETRRLLTEIEKKLPKTSFYSPKWSGIFPGWLRGSA